MAYKWQFYGHKVIPITDAGVTILCEWLEHLSNRTFLLLCKYLKVTQTLLKGYS